MAQPVPASPRMGEYVLASCPACASQAARVVADREQLKLELEELWRFHLRRRKKTVPTQQLYDRAFFTLDPPLQLVQCSQCGTLYRNPAEAQDAVVENYASEEAEPAVFEALFQEQTRKYRAQARRLSQALQATGRALELGSYVGAFLAAAREFGRSVQGLDVNADAVSFARSKGLEANVGTLETLPDDAWFDAIAIWNCFDQLPDPRSTLSQAHGLLRPRGVLAIRVPNGQCYAEWRNGARPRLAALSVLAHNNLLGFPYRQGFTPASLRALLERSGFNVKRVLGDVLVSTADEWTHRWAIWEERLTKGALRLVRPKHAPWFEIYAVRR